MEQAPFISIIVPVYKVEQYLPQCIESILAQTFTDFELLLINDGSPDTSGIICEQYAAIDNRIRVFHQQNKGASTARNVGLDHARGTWICFIDSDDYVGNNYLSAFPKRGEIMEEYQYIQGFHTISESGNKILYSRHYPELLVDKLNMAECVNKCNFLDGTPWGKFFNKNIIERIGLRFHTDLPVREDAMFVYKYRLQVSAIKLLSATEYHYRKPEHRISLSHNIHPHFVFLIIKEELPPLIEQTLKKFNIHQTNYGKSIISYYKESCCISLIKSLYAYRVKRKERLLVLRNVFNDKTYFDDIYFVQSKILKTIKLTQTIFTIPIFDMACYLLLHSYYKFVK